MNKKPTLEERCLWDKLARDEESTTFMQVCCDDTNHPLYDCAYSCNGLNKDCDNYKVLKIEAINVYGIVYDI